MHEQLQGIQCMHEYVRSLHQIVFACFGNLQNALFSTMDLDTCLTPEAKNWTDLNCSPSSNVWDVSGHKIWHIIEFATLHTYVYIYVYMYVYMFVYIVVSPLRTPRVLSGRMVERGIVRNRNSSCDAVRARVRCAVQSSILNTCP